MKGPCQLFTAPGTCGPGRGHRRTDRDRIKPVHHDPTGTTITVLVWRELPLIPETRQARPAVTRCRGGQDAVVLAAGLPPGWKTPSTRSVLCPVFSRQFSCPGGR